VPQNLCGHAVRSCLHERRRLIERKLCWRAAVKDVDNVLHGGRVGRVRRAVCQRGSGTILLWAGSCCAGLRRIHVSCARALRCWLRRRLAVGGMRAAQRHGVDEAGARERDDARQHEFAVRGRQRDEGWHVDGAAQLGLQRLDLQARQNNASPHYPGNCRAHSHGL
jgi:hypothetical protein